MSEEQMQEATPDAAQPNDEIEQLKKSVAALEKKNYELIGKLKNKENAAPPEDYQELLDFKKKAEQTKLESEGKYTEARQALEQQYREATSEKDQKIAELEARVRELELVTPAVSVLSDIVHDPDMVLQTKLKSDQIEIDSDGTVVVVDGYKRTPMGEWARSLPAWMQKQPKPQGSGAPTSRASATGALPGKNPFARETFNLTEQSRLFRTDRDLYDRLKAAAAN